MSNIVFEEAARRGFVNKRLVAEECGPPVKNVHDQGSSTKIEKNWNKVKNEKFKIKYNRKTAKGLLSYHK